MQRTITNLNKAALTAAGVRRGMNREQAQQIADAEMVVVIIPGEGEYLHAVPTGYGVTGVSKGSWECFEAECVEAGWIVKVAK